MGMTKNLFKNIRDTKGTFHEKMKDDKIVKDNSKAQ